MSKDIARNPEATRISKLRSATRRVADVASDALHARWGQPLNIKYWLAWGGGTVAEANGNRFNTRY